MAPRGAVFYRREACPEGAARGPVPTHSEDTEGEEVKRIGAVVISVLVACAAVPAAAATEGGAADLKKGEALFSKQCAVCHPGGGNVINAKKPINRKALESRNIKTAEDIVKVMRNPVPPMLRFDEKTIPQGDALAIGEYILKTFVK